MNFNEQFPINPISPDNKENEEKPLSQSDKLSTPDKIVNQMSEDYLKEIQQRIADREKAKVESRLNDELEKIQQAGREGAADASLREETQIFRDLMEREELNNYLAPDMAVEKLVNMKIVELAKGEAEKFGLSDSQIEKIVDKYRKIILDEGDILDERKKRELLEQKDLSPELEHKLDVAAGRTAIQRLLEIKNNDDLVLLDSKTLQPLNLSEEEREKREHFRELLEERISKIAKQLGEENTKDLFTFTP